MTEHPLTDEICDQIQDSVHPCDPADMRAAADWQLGQVIEWLQENLLLCDDKLEYRYLEKYLFSGSVIDKDKVVEDLKQAMRQQQQQQQQQENNNG